MCTAVHWYSETIILETSLPGGSQKFAVHSIPGIVKSLWIPRHHLEHYHNQTKGYLSIM